MIFYLHNEEPGRNHTDIFRGHDMKTCYACGQEIRIEKVCVECGKKFITDHRGNKFCSKECKRGRLLKQWKQHRRKNYQPTEKYETGEWINWKLESGNIEKMLAKGMTLRQIAKKYNRTYEAIRLGCKRYKIGRYGND